MFIRQVKTVHHPTGRRPNSLRWMGVDLDAFHLPIHFRRYADADSFGYKFFKVDYACANSLQQHCFFINYHRCVGILMRYPARAKLYRIGLLPFVISSKAFHHYPF